jgi:hypothetical protein
MRTCSQKNIEENSGRTKAGFHPECEATYVDPQSPLVFNLKTGKTKLDRSNSYRPRLLTSKADGCQLNFPHACSRSVKRLSIGDDLLLLRMSPLFTSRHFAALRNLVAFRA